MSQPNGTRWQQNSDCTGIESVGDFLLGLFSLVFPHPPRLLFGNYLTLRIPRPPHLSVLGSSQAELLLHCDPSSLLPLVPGQDPRWVHEVLLHLPVSLVFFLVHGFTWFEFSSELNDGAHGATASALSSGRPPADSFPRLISKRRIVDQRPRLEDTSSWQFF